MDTQRASRITVPSRTSLAEAVAAALEHAETGLLVLDRAFTVVRQNTQITKWLGVSVVGETVSYGEDAALYSACELAIAGEVQRVTLRTWSWTINELSLSVECLPSRIDGDEGVVLLVRDSTELDGLRSAVSRINRSETVARLAGGVAHDINNLLTGIRGSLALAAQHPSEASRRNALSAADSAAARAGEVARQLLSFNRGGATSARSADPGPVLRETSELLACMLDGLDVDLHLSPDLGQVNIPAAQLHRVALNLLLNARDSVREAGGGSVSLSAERFHCARPGDAAPKNYLKLTVSDTGLGMDAETQKRVFEPFFSTKTAGSAGGLGLTSVRSLVEQAGGWVDVESALAHGTHFNVYLPLVGEGVGMSSEHSSGGAATTGGRVLICDDETRLATLTAGLLEEYGYESATVSEGDEALEIVRLKNAPVDVLLLDVNLAAGISASTLLEHMQALGSHIPVILTSGFALEDLPAALREHSRVKSYLAKPYTVEELVEAIAGAMKSGR